MKLYADRIVEILESRIAPAVFFVSGTDLTIHDHTGATVAGDTVAASNADVNKALLLHKGDSLVYDGNNDQKIGPGDYTMFIDSAGESMVFLYDVNGDGKFETADFTGVAAGDGFKGTINGTLHGSVATLLTKTGAYDPNTIQPAAIAGLILNGYIESDVVAGKGVSGITAKLPPGGNPLQQTIGGGIYAGDSFNGASVSFNKGQDTFTLSYTPADGEAGASISKVTLPGGTGSIIAGNAAGSSSGPGAKGGSLTAINLGGGHANLVAGMGGNVTSGAGGDGGDIIGVKILARDPNISINAGQGGLSSNGTGGAGGKISALTLTELEDGVKNGVFGGIGGDGGGTGNGGTGGVIEKSSIEIAKMGDDFQILGGAGGSGGSGVARGGDGGALNSLTITTHGTVPSGKNFGNDSLEIFGGIGGTAGGGGVGSVGGNGGAITKLKTSSDGVAGGQIQINGGQGGGGGLGVGDGGKGGDLSNITGSFGTALDGVVFNHYPTGARGGDGGVTGGNGGNGGNISKLAAVNLGYVNGFYAYSGHGGNSSGASGNAGNSGSTNAAVFTNRGGVRGIGIYSNTGGNSVATSGNGGNAGSLTNATINNLAFVGGQNIFLGAYYGGNATHGNGGKGGDASHLKILDSFGATSGIYVYAGSGGRGGDTNGKGGNAGTLSASFVKAPLARCNIGYNFTPLPNAGTGAGSMGGNGGLVTGISGTVGELRVFAYPGGNATDGTGGDGGNIDGIKFTVTRMANIIFAGDGGNATTGTPGKGGNISNVVINGDIGDFSVPFDTTITYSDVGMGGLVAGRGGALNGVFDVSRNGSINNVSAHRIAAIVAGSIGPGTLVAGDAVASITKLKAAVIGADLNNNGAWDFTEGATHVSGFQFHDDASDHDDLLIDGLVLVKTGGFASPPVTPLNLITVP